MSALGALIVRGMILLLQVVPVGLSLGLARSTKDPGAKAKINEVLLRAEALCILPDQNAR